MTKPIKDPDMSYENRVVELEAMAARMRGLADKAVAEVEVERPLSVIHWLSEIQACLP